MKAESRVAEFVGTPGNSFHGSFTEGAELELDDATKMVGCYKALAKVGRTIKKMALMKTLCR